MNHIKTGICLLGLFWSLTCTAGTPRPVADTIDYRNELLWVFEHNQTSDSVQMNFRYLVHVVDGTATLVDSLHLAGRFQGKKYTYTVGDILQVQDEQYKVTGYRPDSSFRVEKPGIGSAFQALYQLNLIDRPLYTRFVDTVLVKDSGQHRIISLLFKPQAPFIRYEVVYTKVNYRLEKIQYQVRTELAPANNPAYVPARYRRITLLREPNTPLVDARPINSRDCITWQAGKLIPAPAYHHYRIIAIQP